MHQHSAHNEGSTRHTKEEHSTMAHTHHMEEMKKRFNVSMIVTIPILLFSPTIQSWFGFSIDFPYREQC